jgi:FkbM family methyltransferase
MNPNYYLQRIATELAAMIEPKYSIDIGGKVLSIPGRHKEAAYLASNWKPKWKTKLIARAQAIRPGSFLDVGANLGHTLVDFSAAHSGNRYIGFEPNPLCVQILNAIISQNNLDRSEVVPIGLASTTGILKLFVAEGEPLDQGASTKKSLRPEKKSVAQWIPCYRLDDLNDPLALGDVSLIKIDVEGAELEVIDGMTGLLNKNRPLLICEVLLRDSEADVSAYETNISGLLGTLNNAQYEVFSIKKNESKSDILRFDRLDRFPSDVWSVERAEDCDYLFVPEEAASEIDRLLDDPT